MSHTMNNPASEGSGVFDSLSDSGFANPKSFDPMNPLDSSHLDARQLDPRLGERSAGEAELRRVMRARLNAYFDAEGQRDRVGARETLHDLSRMPGGADELASMRRVLSGFDTRPEHPDLTRLVLAKVAKRGMFLSKPARRRVSAARVLIAASLLVVVGTFVYMERGSNGPEQGPAGTITAVVEAQRSDAAESVRNLARAVDTLRSDLIEPVGALAGADARSVRQPQRALSMGDTSSYEESTTRAEGSAVAAATGPADLPMTRLLPVARTDIGNAHESPNLAGVTTPNVTAAARALASAGNAWSIAPTPSVLLAGPSSLGPVPSANIDMLDDLSTLHLNLGSFTDSDSIDGALTRGGLLSRIRPELGPTLGSEPEVRLRPDGSRTILWWVFPESPAPAKK